MRCSTLCPSGSSTRKGSGAAAARRREVELEPARQLAAGVLGPDADPAFAQERPVEVPAGHHQLKLGCAPGRHRVLVGPAAMRTALRRTSEEPCASARTSPVVPTRCPASSRSAGRRRELIRLAALRRAGRGAEPSGSRRASSAGLPGPSAVRREGLPGRSRRRRPRRDRRGGRPPARLRGCSRSGCRPRRSFPLRQPRSRPTPPSSRTQAAWRPRGERAPRQPWLPPRTRATPDRRPRRAAPAPAATPGRTTGGCPAGGIAGQRHDGGSRGGRPRRGVRAGGGAASPGRRRGRRGRRRAAPRRSRSAPARGRRRRRALPGSATTPAVRGPGRRRRIPPCREGERGPVRGRAARPAP